MKHATFAYALALVMSLPALAAAQDFDTPGEQMILARINAMRAAQSVPPLSRNAALDAAARAHCADMATQQQLSHVSASSGTPADRVRTAGIAASAVAENVALHRSAELAHEALLSSAPHRANMMSADSTHIGLAAMRTAQGTYVTQVFARFAPAEAPAPAPVPAIVPPSNEIQAPALVPTAPPGAGPTQPPPSGPPPAMAPPNGGNLAVQPGSNGTVVVESDPGNTVTAYWVFGSGRWWYYPFPVGARAGQQLQADVSMEGPPPGFPANPLTGGEMEMQRPDHLPPPPRSGAWSVPPPPQHQPQGGRVSIQPFQGRIEVQPGTAFYAVPPPPMTGRPTRAWRRQHQQWQRAYQQWQREQQQQQRPRPL